MNVEVKKLSQAIDFFDRMKYYSHKEIAGHCQTAINSMKKEKASLLSMKEVQSGKKKHNPRP